MASALRNACVQRVMRAVRDELRESPEARTKAGRSRVALANKYMKNELVANFVWYHYDAARDQRGTSAALRETMRWYWRVLVEYGGFRWPESWTKMVEGGKTCK
jgi:hypothetical protein